MVALNRTAPQRLATSEPWFVRFALMFAGLGFLSAFVVLPLFAPYQAIASSVAASFPPRYVAPVVPARAAYSHSASVGNLRPSALVRTLACDIQA